MPLMVSELYDALRDAGASDEKARAAAEAIAEHEGALRSPRFEVRVNRAMIGLNTALILILLGRSFGAI